MNTSHRNELYSYFAGRNFLPNVTPAQAGVHFPDWMLPRGAQLKVQNDRGREGSSPPRLPNRTGGFPASGSPVEWG